MATYRVWFDKNAVLSEVMLLIDDGTAIVPMPESGTNLVPEPAYRLAFLLAPDVLDEYMKRIDFQVMPVNSRNNQ